MAARRPRARPGPVGGRMARRVRAPRPSRRRLPRRSPSMTDTPAPDLADDLLLSIDCGTQSVRALLFGLRGELVARSQVELDGYVARQPGWLEHDADAFWAATAQACRGLWDGHPGRRVAVRGVAVTTQ